MGCVASQPIRSNNQLLDDHSEEHCYLVPAAQHTKVAPDYDVPSSPAHDSSWLCDGEAEWSIDESAEVGFDYANPVDQNIRQIKIKPSIPHDYCRQDSTQIGQDYRRKASLRKSRYAAELQSCHVAGGVNRPPPPNCVASMQTKQAKNTSKCRMPATATLQLLTNSDMETGDGWFHPTVSRQIAEQLLHTAGWGRGQHASACTRNLGLFLVRPGREPATWVLSVLYAEDALRMGTQAKVYHNRIKKVGDFYYYVGAGKNATGFRALRDIVNHHHNKHPRAVSKPQSEGTLRLAAYVPNQY